jgi:hypothetical protein
MTRQLTKDEIQDSYDAEHKNIGRFSSLLSTSCKYAWAGSLGIFFSTIVAANSDTLKIFSHVFYFLWAAAFLGAIAFIFEILQYIFGYWHARELTSWLSKQRTVDRDTYEKHAYSAKTQINSSFFYLKLVCSILSALFLATGMFLVAFQRI